MVQQGTGRPGRRLQPSRAAWVVFTLLIVGALGVGGYYFFIGQQPPAKGTAEPTPTPQPKLEPAKQPEEAGGGVPLPGQATGRAQPTHKAGTLIVSSDPTGAKITIDGQSQPDWVTPKTFPDYVAGTHSVTVSKSGYDEYAQRVTVLEGKTASINPTLNVPTGEIILQTMPPGLAVFIDGRSYGPTPMRATLPAGQHTYTVVAPGREPFQKSVEVRSGAILTRHIEFGGGGGNPPPPPATSGYIVAIDGNSVLVDLSSGQGMQQGTRLVFYKASDPSTPVGVLEVTQATDSGSRARIITINSGVKPEFGDTVRVQPAASRGVVLVRTIPPGASVVADGKFLEGSTPSSFILSVGHHVLVISLPGYRQARIEIEVNPGENPPVDVILNK